MAVEGILGGVQKFAGEIGKVLTHELDVFRARMESHVPTTVKDVSDTAVNQSGGAASAMAVFRRGLYGSG